MSENKENLDPKTTAKVVRLALEFSRQLKVLADETGRADNVGMLRYHLNDAAQDILTSALQVPGIRIAVFPEGEEEKGGAK